MQGFAFRQDFFGGRNSDPETLGPASIKFDQRLEVTDTAGCFDPGRASDDGLHQFNGFDRRSRGSPSGAGFDERSTGCKARKNAGWVPTVPDLTTAC